MITIEKSTIKLVIQRHYPIPAQHFFDDYYEPKNPMEDEELISAEEFSEYVVSHPKYQEYLRNEVKSPYNKIVRDLIKLNPGYEFVDSLIKSHPRYKEIRKSLRDRAKKRNVEISTSVKTMSCVNFLRKHGYTVTKNTK